MLEIPGARARPNNLLAMTAISAHRAAPASPASSAHPSAFANASADKSNRKTRRSFSEGGPRPLR
jgi:hypothetical protein